ncbi:MAG: hypothetical protein LBN95_05075 [Prevotellaceae bacterium]|jgi:hypothetical protein|nr:hypothetical protein [Prevotellaceae bacterium]
MYYKKSKSILAALALLATATVFSGCNNGNEPTTPQGDYVQFAGKTAEIVGDLQLWDFGNMYGNGSYVYHLVFTLLDKNSEGTLEVGIICGSKSDIITAGNKFTYTFDKDEETNTLNVLTLLMPDRTGFNIDFIDKASVVVETSNSSGILLFNVSIEATTTDNIKFTAKYKGGGGLYRY